MTMIRNLKVNYLAETTVPADYVTVITSKYDPTLLSPFSRYNALKVPNENISCNAAIYHDRADKITTLTGHFAIQRFERSPSGLLKRRQEICSIQNNLRSVLRHIIRLW